MWNCGSKNGSFEFSGDHGIRFVGITLEMAQKLSHQLERPHRIVELEAEAALYREKGNRR